jgi:predicted metal-binding membrane protein
VNTAAPARLWRQVTATPMSRARAGILLVLVGLTVVAWVWLVRLGPHGATPTMGLGAPLFLAVWIAMMVATMFPAVAPMVLMFARIGASKRTSGRVFVPTWLFVGGYLLVWAALGVVAYGSALGAGALAARFDVLERGAAPIGGAPTSSAGGRTAACPDAARRWPSSCSTGATVASGRSDGWAPPHLTS